MLEKTLEGIGLRIIDNSDVTSIWDYPSADTALKGLMSAGPAVRAIENNGFEKVHETMFTAIQPYTQQNKHVLFNNKFRVLTSEK